MRYNQPCVCGRSSSGRARPCQGRGSEFEPRRPLQKNKTTFWVVLFFVACRGPRLERVRAQREKRAGGTFWCPCACRGAAAPRASLVARSKIETPSERMVFSFWNIAADGFELAASTCAKRVKSRGEAGFPRMALPFVGCREASSSLVARSKKTRPPFGWSCFLWHAAGQGSKGYERSEKNVPGARFGARVRVAARQRRERASSPAGQGSKRSPARTACQFRWRR